MLHAFPHDALRLGYSPQEAGVDLGDLGALAGSALGGLVGGAGRGVGEVGRGIGSGVSQIITAADAAKARARGARSPAVSARPTRSQGPIVRPTYSALYGLYLSAARAATAGGQADLARRLAKVALEVARSAKAGGQAMSARVSRLSANASKQLQATWAAGQPVLLAAARRMGDAGKATLRWAGAVAEKYGPGIVSTAARNLTIGLVATGLVAAAVLAVVIAVK